MIQIDQPAEITREQYIGLIEGAGFAADDLMELRFSRDGIYAKVRLRNKAGDVVRDGLNAVVQDVFIQVTDDTADGEK